MARVLLFLVALLSAVPSSAQKRLITHEDVFTLARVGAPSPSPNGQWVVFSVNEPNYDPAQATNDLWIASVDGRVSPRRLTTTRGAESGVAWSPDSTRVAFSARRDGDAAEQVYVLAVSGGDAQRVTSLPSGAANPKWRPDGQAMLFESVVRAPSSSATKSTARVFDSTPVRFWNAWLDTAKPHIFVMGLDGSTPVDVMATTQLASSPDFDAPYVSNQTAARSLQAQWSPDGQEVVFAAIVNRRAFMTEDPEAHLFRMKPGKEPVRMTQAGQSFDKPAFSPDGRVLVAQYTRSAAPKKVYSLTRLMRFDWPSATARPLIPQFDRSVGDFTFATDSASLVFAAEDDGFKQLFRVSSSGGTPARLFPVHAGNYDSPTYAGQTLLAMYGSSTQPPEVVRVDPTRGTHLLVSDVNGERLAQLDLPPPEHFWFTARNGRRIHSVIVFPPNLDRSQKYPLIVNPHGGPNQMSSDAFSLRWNYHLLTSPGYVLLATNYAGSTGFGEAFSEAIETDVLRGPAQEILEAVEEAVRRYPFIDRTRQAAVGASYGGYLVNWLNGQTRQFRCIVSHAGASSNVSQYGANDGGWSRELRMGVPVWETDSGQWTTQSPYRYAAAWKTPSLLTQGEIDFRVPVNESLTTFKILQRQGVPARLVIYPDEGHFIQRGENSRHQMGEVVAWLKKYLDPVVSAVDSPSAR
ncbi:MAG: prolyl oligopeptidase family serine peptidase [Vicinamibacterales bacterium]